MILGTFQDKQGTLDSRQRASTTPSDSGGSEREDGDDDGDKEPLVGWLYVGSHNFTPSAWGTLSGSGFSPVLNVRLDPPVFHACTIADLNLSDQ